MNFYYDRTIIKSGCKLEIKFNVKITLKKFFDCEMDIEDLVNSSIAEVEADFRCFNSEGKTVDLERIKAKKIGEVLKDKSYLWDVEREMCRRYFYDEPITESIVYESIKQRIDKQIREIEKIF